jgi:hypothetical protein
MVLSLGLYALNLIRCRVCGAGGGRTEGGRRREEMMGMRRQRRRSRRSRRSREREGREKGGGEDSKDVEKNLQRMEEEKGEGRHT